MMYYIIIDFTTNTYITNECIHTCVCVCMCVCVCVCVQICGCICTQCVGAQRVLRICVYVCTISDLISVV